MSRICNFIAQYDGVFPDRKELRECQLKYPDALILIKVLTPYEKYYIYSDGIYPLIDIPEDAITEVTEEAEEETHE